MISGADVAYDDLERDTAPEEAGSAPSDDPADKVVAGDPDEHLPWPEPALVRSWWRREGHRLPPGTRHILGRAISEATCREAWRDGFQPQRRAAAHELALMTTAAPLPNCCDQLTLSHAGKGQTTIAQR
jgi:hypothetical protein